MINKWYIKKIEGEDYIYQCFTFNPKIQEQTFLGNEFIGMNQAEERGDLIKVFDRIIDAGPEGFMPEFVQELKNIIGEGNYVYDGYEIGEDEFNICEFNLYFLIKAKVYKSSLEKVEQWCNYKEIRNLICWEEKEYP
jgi:hypothetical protein